MKINRNKQQEKCFLCTKIIFLKNVIFLPLYFYSAFGFWGKPWLHNSYGIKLEQSHLGGCKVAVRLRPMFLSEINVSLLYHRKLKKVSSSKLQTKYIVLFLLCIAHANCLDLWGLVLQQIFPVVHHIIEGNFLCYDDALGATEKKQLCGSMKQEIWIQLAHLSVWWQIIYTQVI